MRLNCNCHRTENWRAASLIAFHVCTAISQWLKRALRYFGSDGCGPPLFRYIVLSVMFGVNDKQCCWNLSQEHVLYEFQDEIPSHIFNKTAETRTFFYSLLVGLTDIFFYSVFVDPSWDVSSKNSNFSHLLLDTLSREALLQDLTWTRS